MLYLVYHKSGERGEKTAREGNIGTRLAVESPSCVARRDI
jgi:hypothetical protein